jgi:predicted O-linked N-acetylglucosamine transferase (SPINDLY family)
MSVPAIVPLALPDDEDWTRRSMALPGGLAGLPPAQRPRFHRVAATMSLPRLFELATAACDEDAVALYDAWLAAHGPAPEAFAAWFNLGTVLMRLERPHRAAAAYRQALALKPDFHEASVNLGLALEQAGRTEEALAAWRRSLPSSDLRRLLHMHLGRKLEEEGRLAEAAGELRAALLIDPDQPDVQQHYVHLRQRMAVWPVLDAGLPDLPAGTQALNCGPLAALALHDDPALQTAVNSHWIARKVPVAPERLAPVRGYRHARIRVGYMSTDFCRHAMSYLMAEVLERHDRGAFQVFGYCASPEDGSDIRARVIAALDHHVPIAALSDEAAARRIRDDEIDVLVDLNGLTRGARLGVLRWKPAPVQATYLGYIGPVPLPELDWLITDAVAVPPEAEAHYRPRPLVLEGCYQANDSRVADLPQVTRAEEGLPEDAFAFCCFSHHYKITPAVFAAWTAILARCPGAVLWLVEDGPWSRANLATRWAEAGLAPERLIFAPRVDPLRYRARLALADLFLDTTPYNAGTVASDALRAGLPLLTVAGRAFAARMAASLLTAVGLTDCVAGDLAEYVERAVAIARDPDRHADLKRYLAGDAWARTLGDSVAFTRKLESAYRRIRLRPGDE